jgi:hypothetical protein
MDNEEYRKSFGNAPIDPGPMQPGSLGNQGPYYNQGRQANVYMTPGMSSGPQTPVDPLSVAQKAHMDRVGQAFVMRMEQKYRRGQAEHGGDLHHKSVTFLLDCAIEEAIDQVVYLLTLAEVLDGDLK